MNTLVQCPDCGFRGRLPDAPAGLESIVCPRCRRSVAIEDLGRAPNPGADDASVPIWVDGPHPGPPPGAPEPAPYSGDYMSGEAERFTQYVTARLAELHLRRRELAEAECRFESATMERKQELHRLRRAAEDANERAARLEAKEAELATREAGLAAREARVARAESRAADTDRRTAELRAAIDQLEARRTALADERAALDRRAELLDRAELALHRRSAELDELDEQLRLEQEAFTQARGPTG